MWAAARRGTLTFQRALSTSLSRCRAVENLLDGNTVRIGCSSGFWGDTAAAAPQLVHHGDIDFLVADYLSEITMSLLTAAKKKMPDLGYTPDFLQSLKPLLKDIKRKGIRVIANAGGVNPHACATALSKLAADQGVELSVATVTGDDLMDKLKSLQASAVVDMDSGEPLPSSIYSMNAYLGAFPIAEALNLGAEVVVTGRCVDSALALAPLIHTFGWKNTDYDLLAAGSLAGHLIECGAQATGGIFTDWEKVDGWDTMGFPVVECDGKGQFLVTKPDNTGGLISWAAVAEQLVYEIGDPTNYLLPDVSCDFSQVRLKDVTHKEHGSGAVLVTGAQGKPPTSNYKVSATYADGFRAIAVSPIIGPRAIEKAQKTADAILKRTRAMFKYLGLADYSHTHVHVIGSESSYGVHARPGLCPREVALWIAVKHTQKAALEIFSREIAPAGTGMAPGQTMLIGGRPRVSPVLRLFSFLYPKDQLPISIYQNGELLKTLTVSATTSGEPQPQSTVGRSDHDELKRGHQTYRLEELAFLRSGDKGDSSNIGVIARDPAFFPYLKEALTVEVVREYFGHLLEEDSVVERYELPGISALNFVLSRALGGGGVASLRIDPQGKGYAQMLADYELNDMPILERK